MTNAKEKIGRFEVVRWLGRGGMADVFVCRLSGIGGFEKEVVVKRILPERAGDPHFLQMFLDEARLAAHLSHPNIVQVYEVGEEDGVPFMTMEYVRGVTLSTIIRQAHAQRRVDYGHFARIVARIADALDYAHNAAGLDGQPLGLVHRDVSPSNIVVSWEGVPKLLDFGVAKAKCRLAKTEAGVLKGKPRYMSPEHVSEGALDHRADLYSLGVCLFELTVGRNPWGAEGDNEIAILKNVLGGAHPRPSELVKGFPPGLERIVSWAMEANLERRCPSARVLREHLDAFVASSETLAASPELAAWVRALAPGEPTSGPARVPVSGQRMGPEEGGGLAADQETVALPGHAQQSESRGEPAHLAGGKRASGQGRAARSGGLPAAAWILAALVVVVVGGAGSAWHFGRGAKAPPPPRLEVAPATSTPSDDEAAVIYLEAAERLLGEGRLEVALDMFSRADRLRVTRPDIEVHRAHLRDRLRTARLVEEATELAREGHWQEARRVAAEVLRRDRDNARAAELVKKVKDALDRRPMRSAQRAERRRRSSAPPAVSSRPAPVEGAPETSPPETSPLEASPPETSPEAKTAELVTEPRAAPPPEQDTSPPAAPPPPPKAQKPKVPEVPPPTLPQVAKASSAAELVRITERVEAALVSEGGLRPGYARGVTALLRRRVRPGEKIYPAAMYYFIYRQAYEEVDRNTAAANLAAVHESGQIIKFLFPSRQPAQ